jgi:long-chain acyl-CoA synthetase
MRAIEEKTMQQMLYYAKEHYDADPAIVDSDAAISYAELYDKVMGLAVAYQTEGMKNQKIDLYPLLSTNWIVVYLALIVAGATVVLHEPTLRVDEYMDGIFLSANAEELVAHAHTSLSAWQSSTEDDIATIIFTSGTSGRHKGVMLSQKNLVSDVLLAEYKIGKDAFSRGDRTIPILPMFHMFGITASILAPIFAGVSLHIIEDMKYIAKALPSVRPRLLFVVPMIAKTMYQRALVSVKRGLPLEDVREKIFGGLQMMICGGAALQQELIDGYSQFGIQLLNGYGITECSPIVTTSSYNDFTKGSVGRVSDLPNAEVRIIDNTVHVSGDIVMQGYYGLEKSPFKEIDGKTWFDTEDIGTITADGDLYIIGRESNLIILDDGNNTAPEEIEILFESYHLVQDVMVYEGHSAGRQIIAAAILPNYDLMLNFSEQEIFDQIKSIVHEVNGKLPAYKNIQMFDIRRTDFIRTSLKKIVRTGVNIK